LGVLQQIPGDNVEARLHSASHHADNVAFDIKDPDFDRFCLFGERISDLGSGRRIGGDKLAIGAPVTRLGLPTDRSGWFVKFCLIL
jgi:hypothetical protein